MRYLNLIKKYFLSFVLVLTLSFLVIGSTFKNVDASEGDNNKTVILINLLENGDFSDDTYLPQGPRVDTYLERYEPEADIILEGGWATYFSFTGGGPRALTIVDGVATTPAFNTQSTKIYRFSSSQWAIDAGYEEALPLEIDTSHIYYYSVVTWAEGNGSGGSDFDTSFSVSALGVNIYSIEGVDAPIVPTKFTGNIENPIASSSDVSVNYSSYCQFGCPANEAVNADNFMLFDLTFSFGEGYEPTAEEFDLILLDIEAPEYIDYLEFDYCSADIAIGEFACQRTADNLFEIYLDDFYLKTNRDYDYAIESTFGDITPLDARPILNTVYGNTIPYITNIFGNYLDDFYLKTNRVYDTTINSTFGDITPLEAIPILNEVQGLTLNQIVNNGDFANGTTGYVGADAVLTEAGGIMSITGSGGNVLPRAIYNFDKLPIAGNDYIVIMKARVTNTLCNAFEISFDGSTGGTARLLSISNPNENEWYEFKYIANIPSDWLGVGQLKITHIYSDTIDSNGSVMEVKLVEVIDITNTPLYDKTASEIDSIIGDYFEGTKSIEDFELQSIGVNLFDTTIKLYGSDAISGFGGLGEFVGDDISLEQFEGAGIELNLLAGTYNISIIPDITNVTLTVQVGLTDSLGIKVTSNISSVTSGVRSNVQLTVDTDDIYSLGFGAFSGITIVLSDIQIEEGNIFTIYAGNNSATLSLTTNLLSVGTDIRDIAYSVNDTWYKDQYVSDILVFDGSVDESWTEYGGGARTLTYNVRIAVDSVLNLPSDATIAYINNNLFPLGSFNDYYNIDEEVITTRTTEDYIYLSILRSKLITEDIAGFKTWLTSNILEVDYALDTVVTTEIVSTGSLIQESNTTLIQLNNFATEYDIDFITSLDTGNTDYYYEETNEDLYNLLEIYGSGNLSTNEYFETLLYDLNIGTFAMGDYVEDFELKSVGVNLYDDDFTTEGVGVVGLTYEYVYDDMFKITSVNPNGQGTINLYPNITFKPLTVYTFSGYHYENYDNSNTRFYIKYTDGTSDILPTPTLLNTAFTLTSDIDKTISLISFTYDAYDGITTYTDFQIEEGDATTDFTLYNSETLLLTADLLSLKTVKDVAYLDNDTWYKDAYVGIELAVAIGETINLTSISNIKETTGLFLAVDSVNNEYQYGVYGDILTLTGISTVYFELTSKVTTEIVSTGLLVQGSNTTLYQLNNVYTEFNIDFITSLDTGNTNYYYSEVDELLYNLLEIYGTGNVPTYEEFELLLDEEGNIFATCYYTMEQESPLNMYNDYDSGIIGTLYINMFDSLKYASVTDPIIIIDKYDLNMNYVGNLYEGVIPEYATDYYGFVEHRIIFELPDPITTEEGYIYIAHDGGSSIMAVGHLYKATNTNFKVENGIEFIATNNSFYGELQEDIQYLGDYENYMFNDDNYMINHFGVSKNIYLHGEIYYYSESTDQVVFVDVRTAFYDFCNIIPLGFTAEDNVECYFHLSTGDILPPLYNYINSSSIPYNFYLTEVLYDYTHFYTNIFDSELYADNNGVYTYNLINLRGTFIGQAPVFYFDEFNEFELLRHSIKEGGVLASRITKPHSYLDDAFNYQYLFDNNTSVYYFDIDDTIEQDIYLEVFLGLTPEDATVFYNLKRTTDFTNGASQYSYNTYISDDYVMRAILPFNEKVDNTLEIIGMADTAGKVIISAIVIVFVTIGVYFISRNVMITLFVDFLVLALLMVLNIVPTWIMLFILVILLVSIFLKKKGD